MATKTDPAKRFQVGKTYETRSPADREVKYRVTVVSRTPSFVTISFLASQAKDRRCKVYEHKGEEFCYPDGKYSLCPVLTAGDLVTRTAAPRPKPPATVKATLKPAKKTACGNRWM